MGDSNEKNNKRFFARRCRYRGKSKSKKRVCISKKIMEASMHSRVQDEL